MHSHRVVFALLLLAAGFGSSVAQGTHTSSTGVCKAYTSFDTPRQTAPAPSASTAAPGSPPSLLSVIHVTDAFELASVHVRNLDVDAPRAAAVKITLSAGSPSGALPSLPSVISTVTLKDVRSGGAATSLKNTSFADDATAAFPATEAGSPFSATFIPAQMLFGLTDSANGTVQADDNGDATLAGLGGSQGAWVLRVVDLTPPPAADAQPTPSSSTARLALNGWSLELCAAPPTVPAAAPAITASAGPADNATIAAPVVRTANATSLPVNGTMAPTAQDDDSSGLLEELLARLNSVGEGRGGRAGASLANRTQALRDALLPDGNVTLVDLLNDRIDALLAPFNETRVVRAFETAASQPRRITTDSTNATSSSLRGRLGGVFPVTTVAGRGTSANESAGGALWRSSSSSSSTPAIDTFLESFRNLVNLAAGPNASQAHNSTALRSMMLQQSGISLDDGVAGTILNLLRGMGNGQLRRSLGDGTITATLTHALDALTSGPVLSATKQAAQSATSQVQDKYRTSLGALADALRVSTDFSKSSAQDAISFLTGSKGLVSRALSDQIDNYRDLVTSGGTLISRLLQQRAAAVTAATNKVIDATKATLANINQLASGPSRTTLKALLGRQLDSSSALRQAADSLGKDVTRVTTSLFDAYQAQVEAARSILRDSVQAKASQAQAVTGGSIDVLSGVLSRVNDALVKARQNTGPLAGKALDTYSTGLTWLEGQLSALRAATTSPALSSGGLARLAKGSGDGGLLASVSMPSLARLVQGMDAFSGNLRSALGTKAGSSAGGGDGP